MTHLPESFSATAPVFIHGLTLSLGLIVAIGAQNAFVLRQGLRREHVCSVVLFCALADAVLMAAGVFGMAQALGEHPGFARALDWQVLCSWQVMDGRRFAVPGNPTSYARKSRAQACV